MFFSVATKMSNEEILTKNSVTGVRMKNFNIWVVHWKIQFLGGGGVFTKKQNLGRIAGLVSLQI